MDSANKPEKLTEGTDDESIDLSAGFVLKSTSAASEPASAELTPDSFMAQHGNDVDPSAAEPEKFDFVPETPVASGGSEAKPIEGKPAWHWAAERDMPALQVLHFEAEVASDQAAYLPDLPSNLRPIAVAAKDGKIVAGLMSEDSIFVTLIGADSEVLESAGEVVIPILVAQARKEGTRFLQISLRARLAATLDGALQKIGFNRVDGIQYQLDTGVEANEQASTRRN
jgi:hypothetical protein